VLLNSLASDKVMSLSFESLTILSGTVCFKLNDAPFFLASANYVDDLQFQWFGKSSVYYAKGVLFPVICSENCLSTHRINAPSHFFVQLTEACEVASGRVGAFLCSLVSIGLSMDAV
jgi:hypothetical protein